MKILSLVLATLASLGAQAAHASAERCDLFLAKAIRVGQKAELEAKGFNLKFVKATDTASYLSQIPVKSYGVFFDSSQRTSLVKAFQIEGAKEYAQFDAQDIFHAASSSDFAVALPSCAQIHSQMNELYRLAHFRYYAETLALGLRQPEKALRQPLGVTLLATEALQVNESFPKAVAAFRRMSKDYLGLVAQAKALSLTDPGDAIHTLRSQILASKIKNYCGERRILSDFFVAGDPCGNCVAQSLLFTSIFIDAGLKAPEGKNFLVELFQDHIRPVFYTRGDSSVYDVMYGHVDRNLSGGLYKPQLIIAARIGGLVKMFPRLMKGFGDLATSQEQYQSLVRPGTGQTAISAPVVLLANIRNALIPRLDLPIPNWSEQTYDWNNSTGSFGGSAPARDSLDLSTADTGLGEASEANSGPSLLNSLLEGASGFFAKHVRRENVLENDIPKEMFTLERFSADDLAVLQPYVDHQNSIVFKHLMNRIAGASALLGLQPKLSMAPMAPPAIRLRNLPDCTPAIGGLNWRNQACLNDPGLVTVALSADSVSEKSVIWIREPALYNEVMRQPTFQRISLILVRLEQAIEADLASAEFQSYEKSQMTEIWPDRRLTPVAARILSDVTAADSLFNGLSKRDSRYTSGQSEVSAADISPYSRSYYFIGRDGGHILPRAYIRAVLAIKSRRRELMNRTRWSIIRKLGASADALALATDLTSTDLSGEMIEDGSLFDNEKGFGELSEYLPRGQPAIRNSNELWNLLRPTRAMAINVLFDPEFEMSPPRSEEEARLYIHAKTLAKKEVKTDTEITNRVKPENTDPAGLTAASNTKPLSEMRVTISNVQSEHAVPRLDRKPVPVNALTVFAVFQKLLNGSDSSNPAIQFAALPLWTKDVAAIATAQRTALNRSLFMYPTELLLPGTAVSLRKPLAGCMTAESFERCLSLNSAYLKRLNTDRLGTTLSNPFFDIHPVLKIARDYYNSMPSHYSININVIETGLTLARIPLFLVPNSQHDLREDSIDPDHVHYWLEDQPAHVRTAQLHDPVETDYPFNDPEIASSLTRIEVDLPTAFGDLPVTANFMSLAAEPDGARELHWTSYGQTMLVPMLETWADNKTLVYR